jgi:hypothetical protein
MLGSSATITSTPLNAPMMTYHFNAYIFISFFNY